MDIHIKSISEGAINYMRVLGTAKNMIHYKGDIEWIAPQPDTPGPALVFNISLNSENADGRIKDIIPEIIAKNIPSFWFITPNATPENIIDILVANGFPDTRIPDDSDDEEPAMALDLCDFVNTYTYENLKIIIVEGYDEFSHWINVVNVALHGWNMLLAENCFNFVSTSGVVFYLACINDEPVGTLATMRYGNDASLEFVSIKKEYRNKGIGTVLCSKALDDLKSQGVEIVTLRSSNEAKTLYRKLGFKKFFNTTGMIYK